MKTLTRVIRFVFRIENTRAWGIYTFPRGHIDFHKAVHSLPENTCTTGAVRGWYGALVGSGKAASWLGTMRVYTRMFSCRIFRIFLQNFLDAKWIAEISCERATSV